MKTKLVIALLIGIFLTNILNAQDIDRYRHVPKPPKIDDFRFPLLPSTKIQNSPMDLIYQVNFNLKLRDNVNLDCSKFYPQTTNPYLPNGYPVVVMCHGYGDRKETLQNFAIAQAQYGYVVYTFSMRGQGNSGGQSNLISDTEADDLIELINYVRQDTITHGDTSKILVMGGSQGGLIPTKASIRGMKVNSMITALTSPSFASNWIENGCVKMTLLWSLSYTPDSVKYNAQTTKIYNWLYNTGTKNGSWDSIAKYMPIARDFQNNISQIRTPILIENSWQDYFFSPVGNMNAIPQYPVKNMAYFGAVVGHGGDVSDSENQWHVNFFNDWFYYFLWGIDNGLFTTRPSYHYALTTYPRVGNYWGFVHDSTAVFPPAGYTNTRLYFCDGNKLSTATVNSKVKEKFFNNYVLQKNISMQTIVDEEFAGTTFNTQFKKDTIYFESAPLAASVKMFGVPRLTLKYHSDANICQYNLQVSEVLPSGQSNMTFRMNYTDRKYTKNATKTTTFDGTADGHIYQAGSKIRIVVTNLDTYWHDTAFLHTNPFVLPVLEKSKNYVVFNNTYIDLPLKNVTLSPLTQNIFREDETTTAENNSESNVTSLYQNSPNPFNPATSIKFAIPQGYNGNVTLKIYDITGKLVQQLVNQNMAGGVHEVTWNADKYSSGIYFYRLTAGSFTDIKKMMLIK